MKNELLKNEPIAIGLKTTVNDLVARQKARIEAQHNKLLKEAEMLGEQDGSLNLPQTEDPQLSPNELLLKSEYQRMIADCWNEGRPYLDMPHLEYQSSNDELEDFASNKDKILEAEVKLIEKERNDRIDHINKNFQIQQNEIESFDKVMQRDYLSARQELQRVQEATGRSSPLIHFGSKFWYMVLLCGIGIAEVPLNIQIFQKFGEAFFITIIMACSLGIAIPVLAHFTGVFVKQRKEKREYTTFASIAVLLFFVFNFGVSIFRAYVLAEHTGEVANNLNIVIFMSLNLILFVIGLLAAYFRHDESYELEHTHDLFQKEKVRYDKEKLNVQQRTKAAAEVRNNQIKAANDAFNAEKVRLNKRKSALIEQRNLAVQVYDELLNSFVALEAMIEASYSSALAKYRAANLMHREHRVSPQSWAQTQIVLDLKYSAYEELDPN